MVHKTRANPLLGQRKLATGTAGPIVKEECHLTFVWGEYSSSTCCLRKVILPLDANSSEWEPLRIVGSPPSGVCAGKAIGFPRTAPFCP